MDNTARFSASNRSRNNPQGLSNYSWNLPVVGNLFFFEWNFSPPSFERFGYSATTNGAMGKWILQLDSAHQIGPETMLQDFLIVVENGGKGENKSCRNFSAPEIGNAFAYSYATRGAMEKRRWQADSAHPIGPEIPLHEILMVVESGDTGWRIKAAGIFHS